MDIPGKRKVEAASAQNVQVNGDQATITGLCGGGSDTFTLTVTDATNSFSLQTGSGYTIGPLPLTGDITIRQEQP